MAAESQWYDVFYLIYEKTKRRVAKTEECFQRETIASCSGRDACGFVHTHATGDNEENVG